MRVELRRWVAAVVGSAVLVGLASCDPGARPPEGGVQVDVQDPDNNQTVRYTSLNFKPERTPLTGYPQSVAEQQMLAAANVERSKGGTCPTAAGGTVSFLPREPLTFEARLHKAATEHGRYLVTLKALSHTGQNQSTPVRRMVDAGYTPAPTATHNVVFVESLAMGHTQPADVIAAWKTSVRHCAALFEETQDGTVARVEGGGTVYWVMDVAGLVPK